MKKVLIWSSIVIIAILMAALVFYFMTKANHRVSNAATSQPVLQRVAKTEAQFIPVNWIPLSAATSTYPYGLRDGKVYFEEWGGAIEGADPSSFLVMDDPSFSSRPYAKDKSNIYCDDKPIVGADIPSFSLLGAAYSKVDGAFSIRFAMDNNRVYLNCYVLDADPNSFRIIYAKNGEPTECWEDSAHAKPMLGLTGLATTGLSACPTS